MKSVGTAQTVPVGPTYPCQRLVWRRLGGGTRRAAPPPPSNRAAHRRFMRAWRQGDGSGASSVVPELGQYRRGVRSDPTPVNGAAGRSRTEISYCRLKFTEAGMELDAVIPRTILFIVADE